MPVFWGTQGFQGVHIGIFIALAALVVFWALLNRTTLGYEVKAVGFNPDAAAYGGINVKKNLIRAMAISGAFAGLAGAVDMLGYPLPVRHARHPVQPGGLPRHRRGSPRAQYRPRHPAGRAALRRAALRDDARAQLGQPSSSRSSRATSRTSSRDSSCSSSAPTYSILYVWNTPRRLLRRRAKPATSTAELPA